MNPTFKKYLETGYRQYTEEQIRALPTMNASNIEGVFRVGSVAFDQEKGLGAVPWNRNVDYQGFVGMMYPRDFLSFALTAESEADNRASSLKQAIEAGFAVGSPFLQLDAVTNFLEKKPYNRHEDVLYKHYYANQDKESQERYFADKELKTLGITGHEGRARVIALSSLIPTELIPVHFILMKGLRARHLKEHPEIVQALNTSITKQGTNTFTIQNRIQGIWLLR